MQAVLAVNRELVLFYWRIGRHILASPVQPIHLQEIFDQSMQRFECLCTQKREAERQAEHLFQTLLHRAFRGKLVTQGFNDEPASVLLEQVHAEQAKQEAEAKVAQISTGEPDGRLGRKAKQQGLESIQLGLSGLE